MNKATHEFDPHAVLREHKKFFDDNIDAFSPPPKRILTPNESDEKNTSLRPTDHKDYYSVMPKQNVPPQKDQHSYIEESPDGRNKELLIMTIEIGDGNKDTIKVFEHDDPYDLARKFCEEHGLNAKIIEPLAHNIYANMEKVLEERAQILDEENNEQPDNKGNDEGFKDLGIRTGEFRGFNETNQGQQRLLQQQQQQYVQQYQQYQQQQLQQHQYQYQHQQQSRPQLQHKYQDAHQQLNISQNEGSELNYSRDQNNKDVEREYEPNKSANYPDRSAEMSQGPWEPHEKESGQLAFHMRPSFDGKFLKLRNTSQDTSNLFDGTTHHEEGSRNLTSKPLETTYRRSNFDYPSDFRMQNSSYLPETFQNEEEYLEYLVASQYGGNPKKDNRKPDYSFKPQINQNSRIMLESKYQNSSISVYDRLHNYAKHKSQTKKDSSISQRSARKSVGTAQRSTGAVPRKSVGNDRADYQRSGGLGVGLYNRGMKRKEELRQMLSEFKHEKILEEERSCTFKPRINRISAEIVNSKPKYESTEISLINYGKAKQEKLERAKSIQKVQEVEGCTFQPMINSISAKLVQQKEHMTQDIIKDRFTKLYYDQRVREAQQEARAKALLSQSGCTFTPMINSHSEAILDRTTIDERAMKFAKKVDKMENLRRQREEMELFDPETGQPLFRPSVGRSPKKNTRERKQSIGDYLYNQRFEKENLRKNLSEKEKKQRNSQLIRTSEKSKLIMENIQRTKLQEIFNLLDSDEDGYISSSKIDIGSIGTDILEAFAPLLCEMEELNQVLGLGDFIEAAEKLLRTLPVHQRDQIIMSEHFNRRTTQIQEFRFHPEINKKSARIAQGVRPYGNFEALYDRYIDEKKIHEDKIKLEQQKRREEELRECSFKPMRLPESDLPLASMNNYNYYYVDHLI